jgi:hypothetical protein
VKIWFDPTKREPDADWIWCKAEQSAANWILAEPRVISIPEGKEFDHLAAQAKSLKVKCVRH